MAENNRTKVKAAIKRASNVARREADKLDGKALDKLTQLYKKSADDLRLIIESYAGTDGTLRLEVMNNLLEQTNQRLTSLHQARDQLLDDKMIDAATLAVVPFQLTGPSIGIPVTQIANDAVQTVRRFIAEDGLQLSDRIWRIDNHAKQVVGDAIQSAVIQGHSATKAALDFISSGQSVPGDIASKMANASATSVGKNAASQLLKKDGSPYANALRLFRTEINRAHGTAYQASAFKHPDVIGTRFLLSPNHPRLDVCDMHARVNRYGLGPGVYPEGKNPWPAHPNTLSYVEAVFSDEVTADDKAGKTDRISWLEQQPIERQNSVLGFNKGWMLREGRLRENAINTPWNVLKKRLDKAGVDMPVLANKAVPPAGVVRPWRENSQQAVWHESSFSESTLIHGAISRHDSKFKGLIDDPGRGAYYSTAQKKIHASRPMGGGKFERKDVGTWRHEYGHFLDNVMGASHSTPTLFRSSLPDFVRPMTYEIKDIIELSGFGRKSNKQSALFTANAKAISDALNDFVEAGADGRARLLQELAQDIGVSLDEVKQSLLADTLIDVDSMGGQIKTAQLLTAVKRKDVYNFMNIISGTDYKERRGTYDKGLVGKFSDLIGSASKNKLAGHGPGGNGGHSNSYYKSTYDQTTEVFANYTALLGAKEPFWHKLLVYLMPDTTLKYREIINNE